MSHAVETMFYHGKTPWHGLGVQVANVLNSEEAIIAAGLNWEVIQVPLYANVPKYNNNVPYPSLIEIPNMVANVRKTDSAVLGVVSTRYQVVQNRDAFLFTDELLGSEAYYETAGSLFGGKKIWLLAKLKEKEILGDKTAPYLVFTNSHDGMNSVAVAITPVRVVCQNTLRLALKDANRTWTARHSKGLHNKLLEAKRTLELADEYLDKFSKEADKLRKIRISNDRFSELVNQLIPLPEKRQDRALYLQSELFKAWNCDDLQNFKNTGWAAINAVSDFVTHTPPSRIDGQTQERLFNKSLMGMR